MKAAEEKKELKNKEYLSDRTVVGGFTWAELKAENAMGKKEYFIKKAIYVSNSLTQLTFLFRKT